MLIKLSDTIPEYAKQKEEKHLTLLNQVENATTLSELKPIIIELIKRTQKGILNNG